MTDEELAAKLNVPLPTATDLRVTTTLHHDMRKDLEPVIWAMSQRIRALTPDQYQVLMQSAAKEQRQGTDEIGAVISALIVRAVL